MEFLRLDYINSSFSVSRSFWHRCQNCIREKKNQQKTYPYQELKPRPWDRGFIEHDYIRIIKVSVFQAMGSSTGVRHERQEWAAQRVQLLIGVSFSLNFFLLYNSGIDARMIYLRENSIVLTLKTFQIVHASSLTWDGFLKFAFECDDC